MNTLNQESRVENITMTGVIDGANVKLTWSRENDRPIRQMTAHAEKKVENGTPVGVYVEYSSTNRSVIVNAHNIGIDGFPMELVEKVLVEMQMINQV